MKYFLTLILLLCLIQTVVAQGEFIFDRKSAFSAYAGFAVAKESYSLGPGIAVSVSGVVDLSAEYSWVISQFKGATVSALSASAAVHFLKPDPQDSEDALTLSGVMGYQNLSASSETSSLSMSNLLYGPALHLKLPVHDKLFVQPSFAYLFITQIDKTEGSATNPVSHITQISLPFAFVGESSITVLSPAIGLTSEDTAIGLTIAWIGFTSQ